MSILALVFFVPCVFLATIALCAGISWLSIRIYTSDEEGRRILLEACDRGREREVKKHGQVRR